MKVKIRNYHLNFVRILMVIFSFFISFNFKLLASLDKRVDDLKKIFHEKKLIHHTTMENKKSRSGYIEISKIFKNYGFVTQEYIEAFSSGEESDIEDDKIYEPSVRELNEKILDFRTIICVVHLFNFIYLIYNLNKLRLIFNICLIYFIFKFRKKSLISQKM